MPKFQTKQILAFLLFAAAFALLSAYIAQFIFGYQPCILCLYQRTPFFLIIAISTLALFFKDKIQSTVIFCVMILLLTNVTIASYQVGVEQKIFKGPDSCSSDNNLDAITDLEELKTAMMQTKAVRCDEPEFFFLSLSMAAWNAIYCFMLFILALSFYRNRRT